MADAAPMGDPAVRVGVPDNHVHVGFVGMRKAVEMMRTGDRTPAVQAQSVPHATDSAR